MSVYQTLSTGDKISLMNSMRILTKDYLKSYQWDISGFRNRRELVNDLYFYWIRHSAEKDYKWCQYSDEVFLSPKFAQEMKKNLRTILDELL